jgi:hypothetical protein
MLRSRLRAFRPSAEAAIATIWNLSAATIVVEHFSSLAYKDVR